MDTLLIVDGNAIAHRAYHALPPFKSKNGIPTNAVYGFAGILHNAIVEYRPNYIAVCFDTAAKTFRDDFFDQYRAHRPDVDENLIHQFPMLREYLRSSGIEYFEKDGYEADDLIATIVHSINTHSNLATIILTGDKDIFQLASDKVLVATPTNGGKKPLIYDSAAVKKKLGVPPKHVADLKALAGDPSDNYKGVAGIGPKTAAKLITEFGSIESIYRNLDKISNLGIKSKLETNKDNALISKKLAVLKHDVNIDSKLENLKFQTYNDELKVFFDNYEFKSLKRRFFESDAHMSIITVKDKPEITTHKDDQLGLF